jgi:hypothetical protein
LAKSFSNGLIGQLGVQGGHSHPFTGHQTRCRFAPTPPCRLAWCRLRSARRPKVSPEQACVLHWYWSPRTSPLLSMTPMTMCSGLLSTARVWSPLRLEVPCHGGVACCDIMVSNAGISNVVGIRYLCDTNVSQTSPTCQKFKGMRGCRNVFCASTKAAARDESCGWHPWPGGRFTCVGNKRSMMTEATDI